MKKIARARHILKGVAFVVVFAAAASVIVMLLWNALIPSLIGWGAVNFWQAAGLLILCRLLFGGFGRHHGHHHPFGGRRGGGRWGGGRWGDPRFEAMHDEMHKEMKGMSRAEKMEYIRKRMMAERSADCPHE